MSTSTTSQRRRPRKLIYAGLIVALFFLMLVQRSLVETEAKVNNLHTASTGEIDLGGSITRYMLASFRGPLTCGLWWEANEAQARHDYDKMELAISALTKLQPHYRKPWEYQAWNLAYNVAVEFDSIADKYYFVTKGLRWLIEGERINRARMYDAISGQYVTVGDPNMREEIGNFTQNKMMFADEAEIYRIFLQIGCIPPDRRDLNRLRNDPKELEDFKSTYPQLVRRIQEYRFVAEGSKEQTDRELLALLERYNDLPGLYPTKAELARGMMRPANEFPIWPEEDGRSMRPANPAAEENQDCFEVSRMWFEFSLEPLPPPQQEWLENKLTRSGKLYRSNTNKNELIFRANPSRSQSHQAMQLGKEGWGHRSQASWKKAFASWLKFGSQNGLEMTIQELQDLAIRGREYEIRFPDRKDALLPPPDYLKTNLEEYRRLSESYAAYRKLRMMQQQRATANYDHWRAVSEKGGKDDHRMARQLWYDGSRRRSDPSLAISYFNQSLVFWRRMLSEGKDVPLPHDVTCRITTMFLPGVPSILSLAPLKIPGTSNFGMQPQVQDELINLNDDYLLLYARYVGGDVIRHLNQNYHASWVMASLAASPQPGAFITQISNMQVSPITIEFAEDIIQLSWGPFDPYITEAIRQMRAGRDRLRRGSSITSAPSAPAEQTPMGGSAVEAPPMPRR